MSSESASRKPRIAILFQAVKPPEINGARKPMKPGGYQDSGADIAYNLSSKRSVSVVTPIPSPDPSDQTQWCFPDTESGILSALRKGADYLWVNTIVFASHPLQSSSKIGDYAGEVKVIGQPPLMVELYDDKDFVNEALRKEGTFSIPQSWTFKEMQNIENSIKAAEISYPVVGKPIRGRGSAGVKLCESEEDLIAHVKSLFADSPAVMVEQYLGGEEITITVMPPSISRDEYWSMPIVTRFNHTDGIAPYNGVVAVTANSRVVTPEEMGNNDRYAEVKLECEHAAKLLGVTAPIRIDCRRFEVSEHCKFALFDINMKPNMTGPGRPGREDQASLTLMAAEGLGWDYSRLLQEMLASATTLSDLRSKRPSLPA